MENENLMEKQTTNKRCLLFGLETRELEIDGEEKKELWVEGRAVSFNSPTVLFEIGETQYKEQIRDDLIQLGLDDEALALPARKLSGGQKRRTALLRALWAESDTLLLDEPFTGMDPAAMKKAAAMLKARCGTKPTLLATHDQEAIRELGWRVIDLT